MTDPVTDDKPKFEHDCSRCMYLGHFNNHDLYVCARNNEADTIIARWGSEGSAYASGLPFGWGMIKELTEARIRAEAKGIICKKEKA